MQQRVAIAWAIERDTTELGHCVKLISITQKQNKWCQCTYPWQYVLGCRQSRCIGRSRLMDIVCSIVAIETSIKLQPFIFVFYSSKKFICFFFIQESFIIFALAAFHSHNFFIIVTTLSHMQAVGLFCTLAIFLLEFAQLINWLNGGRRQGGEAHA